MIKTYDNRKSIFLLLGLASAVQALLVLYIIPALSGELGTNYGIGFADGYDKLAYNLSEGNGYRFFPETALTLMREPGYPIFLSFLFSIFDYNITVARIANIIMAVISAYFLIRIASKISNNTVYISLVALIFLFHPGTIIVVSRGGFEMLFILLLLLFTLSIYKAIDKNNTVSYLISGIILGIIVLVRGSMILLPLFILLYLLIKQRSLSNTYCALRNISALTLAMILILMPWIMRNYSLVQQVVPTSSVSGTAAHAGQYICENFDSEIGYKKLDRRAAAIRTDLAKKQGYQFREGYYQYFYNSQDEIKFNKYLMNLVINKYAEDPILLLKCSSRNIINFWFAGKNSKATQYNLILQLPVLCLAFLGICFIYKEKSIDLIAPLLLIIVYIISVHIPIHSQARYSIPLMPFIIIFASFAFINILSRMKRKKSNIRI